MSTETHQVLRAADPNDSDAPANFKARQGLHPKQRNRRFQESRIYLQIVDKRTSDKHKEIKALLKPLEFELNSNNPDLIELSDGRIGSLLHHSCNSEDLHQKDYPR